MSEENLEIQEEYEADLLTLEDEDGKEHTFEVIDAVDINDERYLAMVLYIEDPAARLEEDSEMIIMKITELDGEEVLDVVEDDEELYEVSKVFYKRLSEVYDINLDDLENEING